MPKNFTIIGGIVVVVIVGVLAFFFMSSSKTKAPSTTATTQKQETAVPNATAGTIRSLLAKGGNATCTISYPTSVGGETKGNVFISGQKVRSDMTIVGSDGKPMDSHMIVDSGTGYFWSSAAVKGTKMKIDMSQAASASPTSQKSDFDKEGSYNCSSWTVDPSKFALPAGIDFIDTSALTPQSTGGTPTISKSMCDAITDATAKAACMANVK